MQRIAAQLGNLVAIASFAMMLSVQMLHSPLHHCCDRDSACENFGVTDHDHSHHHSDGCSHTHTHQHGSHSQSSSGCPSDNQAPPSHDCQLCEFLAQAVVCVELPVVIEGHEPVSQLLVETYSFLEVSLPSGPYVRGPPSSRAA